MLFVFKKRTYMEQCRKRFVICEKAPNHFTNHRQRPVGPLFQQFGRKTAEIGRDGGGVAPRFLGEEDGTDVNAGDEPCVQGAAWSGARVAPNEQ